LQLSIAAYTNAGKTGPYQLNDRQRSPQATKIAFFISIQNKYFPPVAAFNG